MRDARSGRSSSWDQTGRNQDYWIIPPGESMVLADLEGPGCITHLWMTQFCRRVIGPGVVDPVVGSYEDPVFEIPPGMGGTWETVDPFYYRKVLLKIYWDDQDHPGVLAPLGDFFGIGHSIPGNFAALPITVSSGPADRYTFGGNAALNCYFPMPFNQRARVVVENQNDVPYGQYFYVDYELYRAPLGDDVAYFHAHWRRENPCAGWGPQLPVNSPETNIPNLDGRQNYLVLETTGRGHYVGCNLAVAWRHGSWWGEGDDMIFVDDDTWPPSLHGTGSEDYFNQAWGMQANAYPMNGSALHESVIPGYQTSYRFHLADPVHFGQRIRVTIEHGHANHLADDWSSTAYWYQTLPSPVREVPPVAERLPVLLAAAPRRAPGVPAAPAVARTAQMRLNLAQAEAAFRRHLEQRNADLARDIERTRRSALANAEQAHRLRAAFR